MQMHERNLVLMNILRDIAENETHRPAATGATDEESARRVADKEARRAEILGEIFHMLRQQDLARGKTASGPVKLQVLR
ncbi:hypothetical protein QWE_00575 [Agrobacterium albertimagni AOL15]|uniref:Uncharacterized protein n=2 Tax=Agrobacterium albertimagni TaxID=147266 RepID=K2QKA8_9HYPH|nr:hypothetical protein QWE_00575 [Agrobacterium albertimagni AOL15]